MLFCTKCGIEIDEKTPSCRACGTVLSAGAEALCAEYAGFWKRAAAAVIDSSIMFVVGTVIGTAYIALAGSAEGLEAASNILGILIGWLYFAGMESSPRQATFGKAALGIMVTDTRGGRVSFYRATGRHFGKLVSGITLGFGFVIAGFTRRKQALHDMMFDCLVISKR